MDTKEQVIDEALLKDLFGEDYNIEVSGKENEYCFTMRIDIRHKTNYSVPFRIFTKDVSLQSDRVESVNNFIRETITKMLHSYYMTMQTMYTTKELQ